MVLGSWDRPDPNLGISGDVAIVWFYLDILIARVLCIVYEVAIAQSYDVCILHTIC